MTNEAIEAAARAMEQIILRRLHANRVEGYTLEMSKEQARAAAPALMAEGARLALEAAAKWAGESGNTILSAQLRHLLDPAAIVKGAGHDRD